MRWTGSASADNFDMQQWTHTVDRCEPIGKSEKQKDELYP